MLDKLFAQFRKQDTAEPAQTDDLPRAVAALLVEAARGDQEYTDEEKGLIDHMIAMRFSKTAEDAQAIREHAELAQAESNDLYGFSRVVKEGLDRDGKLQLIEDMWVIALSDAERAPYEEMIIRRLVGLIHLEDSDSTRARRRAADRLKASS